MAMATALLILLLATPLAYAAEHTVGGNSGWSESVDYSTWAAGQTFTVGDTLVFTYGGTHKVDVVNQAGYDNCDSSNAISSHGGGSTTITLSSPGATYFICPTAGHCAGGMKLSITVVAASTGTPPSGSSPSPTGTPTTPSSTRSPPPPPKTNGGAASSGFSNMGYVILVLGAFFAYMG